MHAKGVLTGTGALPNYMPARGLLQREEKHRDLPKAHPLTRLAQLKKGVTGAGCPAKRPMHICSCMRALEYTAMTGGEEERVAPPYDAH